MFLETRALRRASLERTLKPRFLSRVFSSRLRAGVQAGVIAAAATGGAIIGFGVRHNDWSGPFATLGYQVLRGAGVATAPRLLHATAGIVAHVAWMVIWGIAFALVSYKKTPAVSMVFALLVGLVATLLAGSVVPAALGAVKFATMPSVQVALCLALMLAGLVTGRALAAGE